MEACVDLAWPTRHTDELAAAVHRVARDATAAGGAIGWVAPPSREETDRWLAGVLARVADRDGALCTVSVDGELTGFGTWRRDPELVFQYRAELVKVTVHPSAQGRGLGRLITVGLIASARSAGMEHVHMRVRGNNTRAIELYRSLGFAEYGRMPNSIAVGRDRFDAVWLYRELERPRGIRLRGSA
jgi:ribosomal protein S18 acetylase RimI-like enzyme